MKKSPLLILSVLMVFVYSAGAAGVRKTETPPTKSAKTIAGTYIVAKSYPLTKAVHGIDGVIQLLQDRRLTKDDYNKQFGATGCEQAGTHKSALGAVLRIISKHNGVSQVVLSRTYEVSVAWLEAHQLTGTGRQSFLFTLDESIGMGSYAGPMTYFYDVIDGRLTPIKYLDKMTGKKEEMVLMRSLKTGWKIVKSKDGKTNDILHAACRPDWEHESNDDVEFLVYYDRFHFDGKEWVKYERIEKGFWEKEDQDLPPVSRFPAVPQVTP